MEETKNINEQYLAAIKHNVEAAQETGDIPSDFVFSFNDKTWVLTLPQSVMAQKRLMNLRNKFLSEPDNFAVEEEFLRAIAKNTRLNGNIVNIDQLDYGEVEVLKIAYMDSLLLPLSLGGDKAHVERSGKHKVTPSPEYLDWLFLNPVMEGLISYADLKNGTINLYDLFIMNELLEYKAKTQSECVREIERKRAVANG